MIQNFQANVWIIFFGFVPEIISTKYHKSAGHHLKTVVALLVLNKHKKVPELKIQTINQVRKEKLGLSPIITLEKGKGILRIWSLFNLP